MVYTEYVLSFQKPGILLCARQRKDAHVTGPQLKLSALTSIHGRQPFMCCYNLFPEETECVCDYTGERTWELSPDYPWPLLYASLPLLTALYLFTVTNLSCEYDHMLSPMSSNEPPSLEVVLVPDTWKSVHISTQRPSSFITGA